LCVVLGKTHALARQKRIALADLAHERVLAIGGAKVSSHGELVGRAFAQRGLKISAARTVNGYEDFLAMLASGQGGRSCKKCRASRRPMG
ncbi:MAG: LysR family transcriptional regulator substrate-binding protein, partial [Lacunisphaera sp.]